MLASVDPIEALRGCGGRATAQELRALGVRARDLAAAVAEGLVMRAGRGNYRLADLSSSIDTAIELTAVLSHRSAAQHHGLEVALAPDKPEVIVRRDRRLSSAQRGLATVRWRSLPEGDTGDHVTTLRRTLLDCARDLPFAETLTIADSVLRHEHEDYSSLRALAKDLRGKGARRARRILAAANMLAANPFESCLRAIALDAGLDVKAQVQLAAPGLFCVVDLADEGRRLIIEAESFEFHGNRKGFRKDIRRYSELTVFGWQILRFTWEDVMFQPAYVRWALESWRLWHDLGVPAGAPPEHLPRLA